MRTTIKLLVFTCALPLLFSSCKDEIKDVLIPYTTDVTFEDHQLDRFAYKVMAAPFKSGDANSGVVIVNAKPDGNSFAGFALSNKNWRSYPWSLSPDFGPASPTPAQKATAIDSTIFSVYTTNPNKTNNFLVARVKGEDAFISLEKAAVVEHVLVANTSYNYLLAMYGSNYSGTLDAGTQHYLLTGTKVKNIQIANTSTAMYGRFNLPGPGDKNLIRLAGDEILAKRKAGSDAANAARVAGKTETEAKADSTAAYAALVKGFVKLSITGSLGNKEGNTVNFWLALRPGVDPANPAYNFVMSDWNKVDLTSLGAVDKLVFKMSSSYKDDAGNDLTPPYFCLDGIRIRK